MGVDITFSYSVENGLSLDDQAGIFYTTDDPSIVFQNNTSKLPVGSIILQKDITSDGSNLWQRFGSGDFDWRKVFNNTIPGVWEGKLISLPWSAPTTNRSGWVSIAGGAASANLGYIFPFLCTIREIICLTSAVSNTQQELYLNISDQDPVLINTFAKSTVETVFMQSGYSIVVPATKKVRLRAGSTYNGTLKDLLVSILVERVMS